MVAIETEMQIFLSTPSARRATRCSGGRSAMRTAISIHALREEGDKSDHACKGRLCNFYPRPPRGGRPRAGFPPSTSPTISIHALREEGDTINQLRQAFQIQFLSTPSARRATPAQPQTTRKPKRFLSTPSARRATVPPRASFSSSFYFYPRPPRGGRLATSLPK